MVGVPGLRPTNSAETSQLCIKENNINLKTFNEVTNNPYMRNMWTSSTFLIIAAVLLISIIDLSEAIVCYQCSSNEDPKGQDNCGAYRKFDELEHTPVECNSEESHMPGSFCMKLTHQSPKGYIWDGRWRQVIRRCSSVADTGVTGVCNWGVYEDGIYWEECYCSENKCNSSNNVVGSYLGILSSIFVFLRYKFV